MSIQIRLISLIPLLILFTTISLCPIGIYLLISGSIYTKIILIMIYIYQISPLCKKERFYIDFLKIFSPEKYFKSFNILIDSKSNVTHQISEKKTLFCFHPHGILSFTLLLLIMNNDYIKNSYIGTSRGLIYMPFTGIFSKWFGFQPVNNTKFENEMRKENNITILPGGYEEATLTDYNKDRIYIKCRKGFIKYGLKYGYRLQIIYAFNENKLFKTINFLEKIRLFLNKLKIPGVIFYGGSFLFFPSHDIPLDSIISSGIDLPKIDNPTQKDIDYYHELYVKEVEYLYYKYCKKYNGNGNLEIF